MPNKDSNELHSGYTELNRSSSAGRSESTFL